MKKAVIVFSGYNQRAVIALLRTLEKNSVPYGIIASSPEDTIFQTKYTDKAVTRSERKLNTNDLIRSIAVLKAKVAADSYIIAPSTEALNRFLLEKTKIFEEAGCAIPLVSKDVYSVLSDKESFNVLCKNHGLLVPCKYKNIEDAVLPFVAKPKVYQTDSGSVYNPIIIQTKAGLEYFKKSFDGSEFFFQEFIDGESYYLLYYVHKDGSIDKLSQQNYVQQPGGKSIIAAKISGIHLEAISKEYEQLLSGISYRGLIMIEVKKQNGQYRMIEANPRMWGPSQLFVDAGFNLFESFLCDNNLLNKGPDIAELNTEARYFWYGGFAQYGEDYDKVSYHGYDKAAFLAEMPEWTQADVYNRSDTLDLFRKEVQKL